MKYLFILSSFILISIISFAQDLQLNQYTIKSGHIEYKLTGCVTGSKEIWWDNYGKKICTETKAKSVINIFGTTIKEEIHTINIIDGNTIYDINLIEETARKTSNEEYEDIANKITDDMTKDQLEQLGEDILEALGGERIGTEDVLGKECEILKILMAKIWIYKGIPLKSETKVMGIEANEKAVKFEENIYVPASKFIPDSNIDFQ